MSEYNPPDVNPNGEPTVALPPFGDTNPQAQAGQAPTRTPIIPAYGTTPQTIQAQAPTPQAPASQPAPVIQQQVQPPQPAPAPAPQATPVLPTYTTGYQAPAQPQMPAYGQPVHPQLPPAPTYGQPTMPSMAPQPMMPVGGIYDPMGRSMEKNSFNNWALALSLIGLCCMLTAIPGAIMGFIGYQASKDGRATNGGIGMAALIVGVLVVVGYLIYWAFLYITYGTIMTGILSNPDLYDTSDYLTNLGVL